MELEQLHASLRCKAAHFLGSAPEQAHRCYERWQRPNDRCGGARRYVAGARTIKDESNGVGTARSSRQGSSSRVIPQIFTVVIAQCHGG